MEKGIIKFFMKDRDFGFITRSDGTDIFFHGSDLGGFEVDRGQGVTFSVSQLPRGLRATDVRPVDDASSERRRGKVKFTNRSFGFIAADEAGERHSLFFHFSAVLPMKSGERREPVAGCLVAFEESERWGKPAAVRIEIVNWPEPSAEQIFAAAEELPPQQ